MKKTSSTVRRQIVKGKIVKLCSINTVRVATKITKVHPLYRKRYSQLKYYLVHDPKGNAEIGQEVVIESCRPISKLKHWTIQ